MVAEFQIRIRECSSNDALAFLQVHHAAVRHLSSAYYPKHVLDAWAPQPITDEALADFLKNPDEEWRIVAEVDRMVAGIGSLVARSNELRACYVSPELAGNGVGRELVRALENKAREKGLGYIEFDSSLNAEGFYAALSYQSIGKGRHILRNEIEMDCIRMRKVLGSKL